MEKIGMQYLGVAIGTTLLAILVLIVKFKMGWMDEFVPYLLSLGLWSLLAFILSKTLLIRRTAGHRKLLSFREVVITLSLVFVTICANTGFQAIQIKIFGHTYTASYTDPEQEPGSTEVPVPPSVTEKLAQMAASVSAEEISSRWITLGALLMAMSSGWALFLSSLIFALEHTMVPILIGAPEIGFFRIAPTFVIGIGSGIAFMRSGLSAAILVHFLVNMVGLFAHNQTDIADAVIFGSAFVALLVLPLTLWFTRGQRQRGKFTLPAEPAPNPAEGNVLITIQQSI